jgi:hypothetical protein
LYRAQADRELAARFVANYRHAHNRALAGELVGKLNASTTGRAHDVFDDTESAMETLDDMDEADARTYGRVAQVVVWLDLALGIAGFLLVLGDTVRGAPRLGRMAGAAATALVCLAIAVAAHLVCGAVVFEANDDIGAGVLALGLGAYLMPLVNAVMVAAMVAGVVLGVRGRGRRG